MGDILRHVQKNTRTVGVHNPQLEGGECRNVKRNRS